MIKTTPPGCTSSTNSPELRESGGELFCVGVTETRCTPDLATARARFQRNHALLARPGIDPALRARFAAVGAEAAFVSNPVEQLGHRWIEAPHRLGAAIELALSRRALLDWLAAVTGCGAISHIEGRVVETRVGGMDEPGDGLVWHSDTFDRALLGLTLHLGDAAYTGGGFELRDTASKAETFRHAEARAGDVVVFDIDPRCQHRVLPVLSGAPRRVFTGWFVSAPI